MGSSREAVMYSFSIYVLTCEGSCPGKPTLPKRHVMSLDLTPECTPARLAHAQCLRKATQSTCMPPNRQRGGDHVATQTPTSLQGRIPAGKAKEPGQDARTTSCGHCAQSSHDGRGQTWASIKTEVPLVNHGGGTPWTPIQIILMETGGNKHHSRQ